MEAETLTPIDHQESDDIGFSFDGDLKPNETVISAVIEVEVIKGTDPTPEAIKVGPATVSTEDLMVVQRIQPTKAGVTYKLRCRMSLSSGRYLTKAGILQVVRY